VGRPSLIDRDAVLAAGLAIADERGLDAVTMGAVATRLKVTPMALYRHVANKADLLDGIAELLLTEFPPPPAGPWADRLTGLADAIRASAQRHPSVFPLLLQRPATTPRARRARDSVYSALKEAGVGEARLAQTERLVSTAILGFAASEAAGRFRNHSRRQLDADFAQLQGLLGRFIESESQIVGDERPAPNTRSGL
jgi:AcrR family transcriptional regulator